ncbi:class I SAM-dependent methyltransferase [Dokdonia ponticola]|uniref:Class I SAM-dependent methyltransferase n=1 Tax=Dokdonia ponticola TaxID=2041041 RepID=A0ABV9HWY3_9FLAO
MTVNYFLLGLGAAVFLGIFIHYLIKFIKHKSLYPFMPFKYNFRRRRVTFAKTLELLSDRKAKTIIETGTSREGLRATRGDGAGTFVFGKWAMQNNAKLFSVDIDKDAVQECKIEVENQNLEGTVTVILDDSLNFLANYEDPVDFLYLDSYDYSRTDTAIQVASQEHHLKEFQAIESKLHKNTIVLVDDCGLPGGGKGKTVVSYMEQKGWEVLIDAYQILLVHQDSVKG